MTEPSRSLIDVLDSLRAQRPELVAHFYGRPFGRSPELEDIFAGVDQFELNQKFSGALLAIVRAGHTATPLEPHLLQLAERHRERGVITAERLELFSAAMVESLRHFSGRVWSDDLEQQWHAAFRVVEDLFLTVVVDPASNAEGTSEHAR